MIKMIYDIGRDIMENFSKVGDWLAYEVTVGTLTLSLGTLIFGTALSTFIIWTIAKWIIGIVK